MTTKQLDNYGAKILLDFGAKSAPYLTYGFSGWTCISVNNEFCHGIPSDNRMLKEGDLVVRISDIGHLIETEARERGYKIIRNLTGHGIGRSLHEEPGEIANYRNRRTLTRFRKNSVVAIETFISTTSTYAETLHDGWTMVGNMGGFMAQHEHTIIVTEGKPIILTEMNGVWN